MKGCFVPEMVVSEMMEFSLTMPGLNKGRHTPEKSAGTALPSTDAHPHRCRQYPAAQHLAWMIMRHRSRDAFFHPTRCGKPPHLVKTLNFPQKVARQFDSNVVFSRYLATIFAAFVRGSHNAAILADNSRQSSEYGQSSMRPIARIALDRDSSRLRT